MSSSQTPTAPCAPPSDRPTTPAPVATNAVGMAWVPLELDLSQLCWDGPVHEVVRVCVRPPPMVLKAVDVVVTLGGAL